MDTYDKINSISLPSRDEFCDELNDKHISDEEYDRAIEVWDTVTRIFIGNTLKIFILRNNII